MKTFFFCLSGDELGSNNDFFLYFFVCLSAGVSIAQGMYLPILGMGDGPYYPSNISRSKHNFIIYAERMIWNV